jgi:hypothetical protein
LSNIAEDYPVAFTVDGGRLIFASDRAKTVDLWTVPVRDGLPLGLPDRIRKDLLPPLTGEVTGEDVAELRAALTAVLGEGLKAGSEPQHPNLKHLVEDGPAISFMNAQPPYCIVQRFRNKL